MRLRRLPLSIPVSIMTLAGLAGGCELVANIQDITLTGPAGDAAAEPLGDENSVVYGNDATLADAPGSGADASPLVDGAPTDAAAATVDGGTLGNTSDAGLAEAAAPPDPFVGPDGGALVLELVDDMEGTSPSPGWLDGPAVRGTWFTFDDQSDGGLLMPPPGPNAAPIISVLEATHVTYDGIVSMHAAHVTANNGFAIFGDGMGFNVNVTSSAPGTFSASAYRGFVFWARALGNEGAEGTRFNVMDINTATRGSGGICDGGVCNGFFGIDFGKGKWPALTSAWQLYVVYFSDLTRPVWALFDPNLVFDPMQIIGCQFQVAESTAADLWVDDIYFIRN